MSSNAGRRLDRVSRFALAGPVALLCSVAVMAGGARWIPKGPAHIDNIVLPVVLFPAIWAALFFYCSLDRKLGRAWAVVIGLLLLNGGMIASAMLTAGSA